MFIDVLLDTLLDSLKMLPFLLAAYFVIEFLERNASDKLEKLLKKGGRLGFIPGALLGLIPQCGFSGMAANLFSGGVITAGTLIAVFLSTSDEAVPLLIAAPDRWKSLVVLLTLKLFCALLAGFLADFVFRVKGGYSGDLKGVDCHDHDEEESLIMAAIRHTAIIMGFIFLTLFCINYLVEAIGSDQLAALIGKAGIFQIFAAGLVGMIPNCASSVLLTQMYAAGQLSFAAMFAGLCTGSGIGTLVLLRSEKNKGRAFKILGILYLLGTAFGLIIWLISGK